MSRLTEVDQTTPEPNPCVRAFGPGPEGVKCKTCVWLDCWRYRGQNYYKCKQRKMTHGKATDHRVGWRACGLYHQE